MSPPIQDAKRQAKDDAFVMPPLYGVLFVGSAMALSVAGWGLDRLFDYEMSHGLLVVLAIGGALIAGGILQYKGNVENAMKCYESGYRTGHVIGHEAAARQVGRVDPELAQALADLYEPPEPQES